METHILRAALALLPALQVLAAPAHAQDGALPPALGVNVQSYGALPNDNRDDTRAINAAIQDNLGAGNTLYFPDGVYDVSDRLEWRSATGQWWCFLAFRGQSRDKTIIRLKDAAPGYNDSNAPRSVIHTASLAAREGNEGGDNDAYRNHIENLTVDVGARNPGAIGIDWAATNEGAIRNVRVRAAPGSGKYGVTTSRRDSAGPNTIMGLAVDGFDIGFHTGDSDYLFFSSGTAIDGITLRNQRIAGIDAARMSVSIRNLSSSNSVPAVRARLGSMVTIIGGAFWNGSPTRDAIEMADDAALYLRGASTWGYRAVSKNGRVHVARGVTREYASNGALGGARSLHLPIRDAPTFHEPDFSRWANVEDFGARRDDYGDDSPAIQRAIDSGATTIYFPSHRGFSRFTGAARTYHIGQPIIVRKNVRRIWGGNCDFSWPSSSTSFGDAANPRAWFRVENTSGPFVIIEKMRFVNGDLDQMRGAVYIDHASPKALVLRDVAMPIVRNDAGLQPVKYLASYRNALGKGVGPLFLEDFSAGKIAFGSGQQVWARMLNLEGNEAQLALNDGATLWVLGSKTEGDSVFIRSTNGARSELLGGMVWGPNEANDKTAFVVRDSRATLVCQLPSGRAGGGWNTIVEDTRGGSITRLGKGGAPRQRGDTGSVLSLWAR